VDILVNNSFPLNNVTSWITIKKERSAPIENIALLDPERKMVPANINKIELYTRTDFLLIVVESLFRIAIMP
jgi:hypothetical protein